MKTCTRCKEQLSHADFPKQKSSKDGLSWWCKKCHSENWKSRNHNYRKTARLKSDMKWQGVLRYLLDKGEPATSAEIAEALNWPVSTVRVALSKQRHVFVVAGEIKPPEKVGRGEYLWVAWED